MNYFKLDSLQRRAFGAEPPNEILASFVSAGPPGGPCHPSRLLAQTARSTGHFRQGGLLPSPTVSTALPGERQVTNHRSADLADFQQVTFPQVTAGPDVLYGGLAQ